MGAIAGLPSPTTCADTAAMTHSLPINWPEALDAYEPIEPLSAGRISTVFRARQGEEGREVAVKILHDHLAEEQPVRRRLRREFAAVRRLDHPTILRAEELIDTGGVLALVMEYVPGESVRQRVERNGAMTWSETRGVLEDILAGLEHAHRRGVWHRDLNAEHILIDEDGGGRIVGFGLARVDELAALTMHTQVLGALEAMAPERVLGLDYDGRADLYAVGAVAYEMLLGHPPVDGTMQAAFARSRQDQTLIDDDGFDELPQQVRHLLERSLVGDPSIRFATADQMRRALDGVYDEEMWNEWAGRHIRRCPDCGTPVIEGIAECFDCGHEIRRLVRHPGAGDWMIRIISPREAFQPDVWFERNTEPEYLPSQSFDELIELLDSYDDMRSIVQWSPEYRLPPYYLFDGLVADDARRISRLLDERSIPHQIDEELPSTWARISRRIRRIFRIDEVTTWVEIDNQIYGRSPAGFGGFGGTLAGVVNSIVLSPLILFSSLQERHFLAAFVVFAGGLLLAYIGFFLGVDDVRILVASVGTVIATAVLFRLAASLLRRRYSLNRERPEVAGVPLMIPARLLQSLESGSDSVHLPVRTAEVLKEIGDEDVRSELQELIVLAIAVSARNEMLDKRRITDVVDELLSIGLRLDTVVTRVNEHNTAGIYGELERLGRGDDDESTSQRRAELLEALEDHDQAVSEVTALRCALQRCRGALFDLITRDTALDRARGEVMRDLEGSVAETVLHVESELEAAAEVEQL